jgi:hypothetical protein
MANRYLIQKIKLLKIITFCNKKEEEEVLMATIKVRLRVRLKEIICIFKPNYNLRMFGIAILKT